jgi:hypothetical protein
LKITYDVLLAEFAKVKQIEFDSHKGYEAGILVAYAEEL